MSHFCLTYVTRRFVAFVELWKKKSKSAEMKL